MFLFIDFGLSTGKYHGLAILILNLNLLKGTPTTDVYWCVATNMTLPLQVTCLRTIGNIYSQ